VSLGIVPLTRPVARARFDDTYQSDFDTDDPKYLPCEQYCEDFGS